MKTHRLVAHPRHPPLAVRTIEARLIASDPNWLRLRWTIRGGGALVLPPFSGRERADGLWRTTCFEIFVRSPEEKAYAEFNLSPSQGWAAYDFDAPRGGMRDRAMPRAPVCAMRPGGDLAIFDAAVPCAGLPGRPLEYGLSAVIEEATPGGDPVRSFWALAHGDGPPDFHGDACFAARLGPTEAP